MRSLHCKILQVSIPGYRKNDRGHFMMITYCNFHRHYTIVNQQSSGRLVFCSCWRYDIVMLIIDNGFYNKIAQSTEKRYASKISNNAVDITWVLQSSRNHLSTELCNVIMLGLGEMWYNSICMYDRHVIICA